MDPQQKLIDLSNLLRANGWRLEVACFNGVWTCSVFGREGFVCLGAADTFMGALEDALLAAVDGVVTTWTAPERAAPDGTGGAS